MKFPLLMNADCLQAMCVIPDGSVDLILCDLPYGTTACKWDSVIPFEPLWREYWRVLNPNGAVVLTAAQPFTTQLIASQIDRFRYCWYWTKPGVTGFANAKKNSRCGAWRTWRFSIAACRLTTRKGLSTPLRLRKTARVLEVTLCASMWLDQRGKGRCEPPAQSTCKISRITRDRR